MWSSSKDKDHNKDKEHLSKSPPSREPSKRESLVTSSSSSSHSSPVVPRIPPTPIDDIPNPLAHAAELARLQKEEQERRDLYDKAQANYTSIVDEAKKDNIKAYKAAKEVIAQCAGEVTRAVAHCKEYQELLDDAKKKQQASKEELESVKKTFDLNTEVWWQAERTLVSLKKDEMARLQMVQALVDWRDAEVALCTHNLQEKEKHKEKIEKPKLMHCLMQKRYEMAQAELWKTGEELKRLGVTVEDLDGI